MYRIWIIKRLLGLALFILLIAFCGGRDPSLREAAQQQLASDRWEAWAEQCYDENGRIPGCFPPGDP